MPNPGFYNTVNQSGVGGKGALANEESLNNTVNQSVVERHQPMREDFTIL